MIDENDINSPVFLIFIPILIILLLVNEKWAIQAWLFILINYLISSSIIIVILQLIYSIILLWSFN